MSALEVDRHDLHRTRLVHDAPASLPENGVRLRVDAFALTSNNITYGAFGDMLQYWNFFPAPDEWGRIPVWGFGEVVDSQVDAIAPGRRVYGYLPMADELVIEAGRIDDHGVIDTVAHRQPMAVIYNRYLFTDVDPMYDDAREAQLMVLRPLFSTSFLIDDFLADNDTFGASTIVISSASSKTAIGTAFACSQRPNTTVIALTSSANAEFVQSLGCYTNTITYDALTTLPNDDAVYIDIAGNRDVQHTVHDHYRDRLKHSMIVGSTHWDHQADAPAVMAGPQPEFFFAPTQAAKRSDEWGQETLDKQLGAAWHQYSSWTDSWLRIVRCNGPDAVERAYRALLAGKIDPRTGFVCSMANG
jgi:hypothetical protein